MIHTALLSCYCGQLNLCVLSWWRHEVYGIYMSSLFGLFPRSINLINLSSEPYNCLCHLYTSHHLMSHSCSGVHAQDMFFNACFWFGFIDIRVLIPARHLAFITPLVGEFSDSPESACPDPRAWTVINIQLIRVVQQQHSGSAKTSSGPYPSKPSTRLSSFPFVTRECILYYSSLYISLYSRIYAYRWCNIHLILCHIMW